MKKVEIYFNHSKLLVTNNENTERAGFGLILDNEEANFAFRMNPHYLFDADFDKNILAITANVTEFVESLFDFAEGIVAAGGIVTNGNNEILIMYRRGFWDLPKGKVDKGEKIIAAAKREVEEETAVIVNNISDNLPIKTYHCYTIKNRNIIKETYWFEMKVAGTPPLFPQYEEDIEQAIWADNAKIISLKEDFYPLIFGLLSQTLRIGQ